MTQRILITERCTPKCEDGVIRGVKIIGTSSRNGRSYPVDVLRAAKHLYEGAAVFIDHGDPKEKAENRRQLTDHFGTLQAVRERGDESGTFGLFGDLHIKTSHPLATAVVEHAEGGKFGLSHNAYCKVGGDGKTVSEILEVNSVDLVDNPGTTKNLFEGEEMPHNLTERLIESVEKLAARIDAIESRPEKPRKIAVLESADAGDFSAEPGIGNTYDDFLGVVRGFPTTNKGA